MFSRGERASYNIPSDACCGPGKDQSAPLPVLEGVLLERSDNLLGESEPGFNINLSDSLEILICNLQERFPNSMRSIEDGNSE